ncbi:hypothetical protein AKJ09_00808 [Labilithrix luteola]|uniref:Uncharacterized protein n=1 Tax=Labilithrix luteola TaxID=1391654 RepID=A0A0K1PM11_9BACT|nr:hypothetical protein AKJ09_00808 [Labilithrix luteola]
MAEFVVRAIRQLRRAAVFVPWTAFVFLLAESGARTVSSRPRACTSLGPRRPRLAGRLAAARHGRDHRNSGDPCRLRDGI